MKDFLKRNGVWLGIIIVFLVILWIYFGEVFWNFIMALTMSCIAEGVALALSNIAVYAYTHIPFTKRLIMGEDGKMSSVEQHGFSQTLGSIFIGVHVLVAVCIAMLFWSKIGG